MLPSHFIRLCITSATLIAASPLATVVPKSTSLPSVLQQNVPPCAQSCLQDSLVEKFPVACTGSGDIQCLCSRYSNGGESLGEVALGCVYSSCSSTDSGAASAYNVCLGQRDAVMPTKTALTVVASSAPRTTSTSTFSTSTATPTITTTLQTQVSSSRSIFVDSISFTPSATPSPSSTFAAAPAAPQDAPRMTPAQIAGLSVAAVAAFVIAIGLMALSVCLRRRRERRKSLYPDEKGMSQKPKKYSTRVSRLVPVGSLPVPPKRFPMKPPPVARKCSNHPGPSQGNFSTKQSAGFPIRTVQRNGVGTSNTSKDSLPLDQIGVAISAELDGTSIKRQDSANVPMQGQTRANQAHTQLQTRPFSSMTQVTVFEEDEAAARRRSSVLLPTPPVPVAPIRSLKPSRSATVSNNATQPSVPPNPRSQQATGRRPSELYLSIPVRHERPQPKMIASTHLPSTGSPKQLPQSQSKWLAPSIRKVSASPQNNSGGSPGDIDDYYFNSYQQTNSRASPAQFTRSRDSPRGVQVKSKASRSTVSRTVSRTSSRGSTNIRDSGSSQTSFETVDPNDPTPDDEDDDKQLSDENKLSPVAESPISNLRYPKIPRASNQLVPRSPRSPRSPQSSNFLKSLPQQPTPKKTQSSPRRAPSPSIILQNRRRDLAPPLLETRLPLRLNAPQNTAIVHEPLKDPFTTPPRQPRGRAHIRSNSTESWTTTPRAMIDRKSRTQSGMWPSSPAMYEIEAIKPLNVKKNESLTVRRHKDEMKEINVGRDVVYGADGLASPIWAPKLTPSRKGDDLFISVGWGGGRP